MASRRYRRANSASASPTKPATAFAPMRRSRRSPPRRLPSFRPSPTIPASWSTRWTARPGFSRRAGPARTRIFPPRWPGSSGCCRSAAPPRRRSASAHFVSALCVAWPDDHLEEVEARADGTLVWPPRGTAGFGYDPAFLPDGHARTFGEMTSIEKHGLPPLGLGLSHRARAFVKLAEICLERATAATLTLPRKRGRKKRFGVYVHWPFCLSKCPYCDFNSHVRHAADRRGSLCARVCPRNRNHRGAHCRAAKSHRSSWAAARPR